MEYKANYFLRKKTKLERSLMHVLACGALLVPLGGAAGALCP